MQPNFCIKLCEHFLETRNLELFVLQKHNPFVHRVTCGISVFKLFEILIPSLN